MSDLLDQLNENSGALSAVFSGVVTAATVIYAWLTAKLVKETRKMREVQTEPRIQVTYRVSELEINFLNISVRNIGLGPAHDIQFELRGVTDLPGTVELIEPLMKLACFQNGLVYLGPNEEYHSFWISLLDGDPSKLDSRLIVDVTYRSFTGMLYHHDCIIDLSDLKGIVRLGELPLLTIAKQVEALAKDIHNITTVFQKPKVDVYTKADRNEEQAQLKERLRSQPAAHGPD
ncbi:MAG: hypothetical protein AB7O69_17465 [Burkholderiales bacterium]